MRVALLLTLVLASLVVAGCASPAQQSSNGGSNPPGQVTCNGNDCQTTINAVNGTNTTNSTSPTPTPTA